MKDGKCGLHCVAFWLVWVGAINWGLVGLFKFNLVSAVFGSMPALEMLAYILVGVSAAWLLVTHKGDCKVCSGK